MILKEQLITELENVEDPLIAEVLDFLRFLKTKQTEDNEDIADARHVLATIKTAGSTSWEELKAEIGI
jgi:hypothetical protein